MVVIVLAWPRRFDTSRIDAPRSIRGLAQVLGVPEVMPPQLALVGRHRAFDGGREDTASEHLVANGAAFPVLAPVRAAVTREHQPLRAKFDLVQVLTEHFHEERRQADHAPRAVRLGRVSKDELAAL